MMLFHGKLLNMKLGIALDMGECQMTPMVGEWDGLWHSWAVPDISGYTTIVIEVTLW